jgi:very-short-patch-repair endonuclease
VNGPEVPGLAGRQAGVFTRAQAVDEGWSQRQVSRCLASGRWRRVLGKGLSGSGSLTGVDQLAWAAWLSRRDAVVSHVTAALVRGWPLASTAEGPDGHLLPVHLTGRGRGLRVPLGVQLHELQVSAGEVETVCGLPVTTATRTAVDCLMILPRRDGLNLFAYLQSRDLFSHDDLGRELRAATGRPGVRRLLGLFTATRGDAANPAEMLLHDLLREHGLTGWTANARVVHDGRIIARADVLFATERLIVEVDGYQAHSGRDQFRRDRQRQNELVAAGYTVLRVTWEDLTRCPEVLIGQLRLLLASAA